MNPELVLVIQFIAYSTKTSGLLVFTFLNCFINLFSLFDIGLSNSDSHGKWLLFSRRFLSTSQFIWNADNVLGSGAECSFLKWSSSLLVGFSLSLLVTIIWEEGTHLKFKPYELFTKSHLSRNDNYRSLILRAKKF